MKLFYLLFLICILSTANLSAQKDCWEGLRREGLRLRAAKQYPEAINQFFAAMYCIGAPQKDLITLIKQTQNDWVKELNDTKKAAQDALQQLQAATAQTVTLFLKEIDQHILKLEYDPAREKVIIALALNAQQKEVVKRLQEVAFFYTETNQFAKADSVLQLLNNQPNLSERLALLKTIQNLNLTYYDTLQKRYYPEMVNVEGGTFMMGSNDGNDDEKPAHQVTLNSFQIAKTETTVWQYNLFTIATNKKIESTLSWGWWGDNPVVNVSWYDALEYANWLSAQMNIEPVYDDNLRSDMVRANWQANGFRLPTEAEWEFTARGGNLEKDKDYEYAGGNDLDELGWYIINSKNRIQSAAKKKPNALGLYDLSGNVWEWCWDWYGEKYYTESGSSNNPTRPSTGTYHVLRGGSWHSFDGDCRVAYRYWYYPDILYLDIGFRLAQDK
ncbi:MAG: formylglycine-generating enzyme family protein [Saprospiraceae bacterium]|nr:formylglycine-generating enzyme family protein [Saprospiraceae bacterium]